MRPVPTPRSSANFRQEYGNRIHFGLHVVGDADWDFALDDLTWELRSDDPSGRFDFAGDFSGATYSATRVGINYGPDGVRGGGDDTIITGGPGTQRVHELAYVGVGDGFHAFDPQAPNDQADIDETLAGLIAGCEDPHDCVINLTATYALPDSGAEHLTASNRVTIVLVPEPLSSLLCGVGGVVAWVIGRRRRK